MSTFYTVLWSAEALFCLRVKRDGATSSSLGEIRVEARSSLSPDPPAAYRRRAASVATKQ